MRTYKVERNEYGLYTVERSGHGAAQTVCSTENHAEAANVCSALNAMEYNTQRAEAFEAMREALREALEPLAGETGDCIGCERLADKVRAALALADAISGDAAATKGR